jgi:predicted  nucleic acid-binding Zn-ribbon protein
VTDSSDPNRRSRRRRSGPSRVPPTIDLEATEVESRPPHEAAERNSATSAPGAPEAAREESASGPASETDAANLPAFDPPPSSSATPGAQDAMAEDLPGSAAERPRQPADEGAQAALSSEPGVAAADPSGASPRDSLHIATPESGSPTAEPVIQGPREDGRRGPGLGAMAATGLIGGLVGAGLLYGVQTWRSAQGQGDPRVDRLEQQLGTVASRDDLRALDGRLAQLEGTQSGLSEQVQAARTLAERSAALAEEAASRPAPAASPRNDAALTDFSNRINALETQLREGVQAATGATQDLQRRLAEQEQRLATATQPLERRLGEVEQRLSVATRPVEQRVGQLEQRLATATEPLERRFAEQEQRLSGLTQQVAGGGSEVTRAGTRVVLADRLGDALREGAPYAEVLGALRRFTTDPGKLAPLEPFAQSGAPTAAALAQSFKPIAERLRRDARQGPEDWSDRLLRMADKVVTVRTVNEPAEAGVPGTVARIEDALARGSLRDAAEAFEALPEPARQASAEWGQRLQQRAAAEAAARTVAADSVAALDQATR